MSKRDFYVNGECKNCHLIRGPEGHDPCIANLPGVSFACCGHGKTRGYIKFTDGRVLDFTPISIDLDKAVHLNKRGVAIYVKKYIPRRFHFKSRKIRKRRSGYLKNGRGYRIIRNNNA